MDTEKTELDWVYNINQHHGAILRELGEGINTKIFVGQDSMLSFVQIEPHKEGSTHRHVEEQWGILLKGKCTRVYRGEEVEMEEGDFWYTAPNEIHGIRTGESGALILDIFAPPRPEYRQSGSGFGNRK